MQKIKDIVYEYIQKQLLSGNEQKKGLQTSDIASALKMQRSNVSAILSELLKEKRLVKSNTRPVLYMLPKENVSRQGKKSFKRLVGYDGSLRKCVQLAKAAVLYPGSSLNMQILAKPGCGTTYFATLVHQYAIDRGILAPGAPFVKVNCTHFAKNTNVLETVLFGDGNKLESSSFAKAQGGVLFIDNVNILDARQESRIFHFLETKTILSEDGKESLKCSNCIFILGISQNAGSQVDYKVPIVIELPPLNSRPLEECFELIRLFFEEEAENLNSSVEVTKEATRALLLAHYKHNVKELKMEIKSACANAYVRVLEEPEENIRVCLNDFSENINYNMAYTGGEWQEQEQLEQLIGPGNFLSFNVEETTDKKQAMNVNEDVYGNIRNQYVELANRGVDSESIHIVINGFIDGLLKQHFEYAREKGQKPNLEQLSKAVDPRIIEAVGLFSEECKKELGYEFSTNVFYGLCLHLNSLRNMSTANRKRVTDEQIQATIQQYPREYSMTLKFATHLREILGIEIPMEEIVLLTLFVIDRDGIKNKPVLLFALHGNGTAKCLAEVTNMLTYCDNAYAYDMDLSQDVNVALQELQERIIEINKGAGVFVIYDMGSLKTMLDIISEQVNIKIRSMNIPITLLGIEVGRLCSRENDIDQIFHLVSQEFRQDMYGKETLKKAIITLCRTSEGGATQLKKHIDCYSKLGMRTIAMSVMNRQTLAKEIAELRKIYDIHAIVGTFDPCLFGIPFIPISAVFENRRENLDQVLMFEPIHKKHVNYEDIYRLMEEQFSYVKVPELKKILPRILDELGVVYNLDDDSRIGLFMHLASLAELLASREVREQNKEAERLVDLYPDDYNIVRKQLKALERKFKVIINDAEVGTIIMILKKL